MFKGKLTYTTIVAVVAPVISSALGVSIVPDDILPVYQGVLALVGLYGRWRATRGAK